VELYPCRKLEGGRKPMRHYHGEDERSLEKKRKPGGGLTLTVAIKLKQNGHPLKKKAKTRAKGGRNPSVW